MGKKKVIPLEEMPDQNQADWLAAARYFFEKYGLTLRVAAEIIGGVTHAHLWAVLAGTTMQPRPNILLGFPEKICGLDLEAFRSLGRLIREGRAAPTSMLAGFSIMNQITGIKDGKMSVVANRHKMYIPRERLGNEMAHAEKLALYRVTDDTMLPALEPEELVLVRMGKVTPVQGKIYLIIANGELAIRVLRRRKDAEEPHFAAFKTTKALRALDVVESHAEVVGEVIWHAFESN